MQENESRLTVFFEAPFWVGVYERVSEGKLQVCKITFGAEPKDYEVYGFLLQNWDKLRFGPPLAADGKQSAKINPKRMQRAIKKQLEARGVGTKSQQALGLAREASKAARKTETRRQKAEEKQRQFELRQQKRKEKHRGG